MKFTSKSVGNLIRATIRVIKRFIERKPVIVSDELYSKRLTVCLTCPYYEQPQCTKCTCIVFAKCRLTTETCPVGKWEK